jgi:hypothetical protein
MVVNMAPPVYMFLLHFIVYSTQLLVSELRTMNVPKPSKAKSFFEVQAAC